MASSMQTSPMLRPKVVKGKASTFFEYLRIVFSSNSTDSQSPGCVDYQSGYFDLGAIWSPVMGQS